MIFKKAVLLCFLQAVLNCLAVKLWNFSVPSTYETHNTKGSKTSTPAGNGIGIFGLHDNLNIEKSQADPEKFSDKFQNRTSIQAKKLRHRRCLFEWFNTERSIENRAKDTSCVSSSSFVSDTFNFCEGDAIFKDNFKSSKISKNKWLVEEFIPANSQDFEFVSYQNKPEILYTRNEKLFIKPKTHQDMDDVRGELDLRSSCTRQAPEECSIRHQGVFILPPVISGRMVSLVNFRYGIIEIEAKLPAGDWMYPQIYLEEVSNPSRKLWIAYSRGNVHLKAKTGLDIGGHLLYGGLVLASTEPARSGISLLVDGYEYGRIRKTEMKKIGFGENSLARLVLGVGVGGINDFPDGFRTEKNANNTKPWKNKERTQLKNFFEARDKWGKSWGGDNAALQIKNIEITAL